MSNSSKKKKPRVVRKHNPKEPFTESTYRKKSFDMLMEDFGDRCAYSGVHKERVSDHNIEVDHFDSSLTGTKRHAYSNLFPAFSLCNNAKTGVWPTKADRKNRRRYLNPCKEQDYGEHLFENKTTGELVTDTPEGIYHIENLDLNHSWLTNRRLQRTEDSQLMANKAFVAKDASLDAGAILALINRMQREIDQGIPEIPEMPQGRTPL